MDTGTDFVPVLPLMAMGGESIRSSKNWMQDAGNNIEKEFDV
jgi:hypothetical protein